MKNTVKYIIMGICGGLLAACIIVAVIAGQNQRKPLKCTGLQVEVLDSMENGFVTKADIKKYLDKEYGPVSYTHLTLPTMAVV